MSESMENLIKEAGDWLNGPSEGAVPDATSAAKLIKRIVKNFPLYHDEAQGFIKGYDILYKQFQISDKQVDSLLGERDTLQNDCNNLAENVMELVEENKVFKRDKRVKATRISELERERDALYLTIRLFGEKVRALEAK